MKKVGFVLLLIVILAAACFFPFSQRKITTINAPFLSVYSQVSNPANWQKWYRDPQTNSTTDSDKINIRKDTAGFTISYPNTNIIVQEKGNLFNISERFNNKSFDYSFTILPSKKINQSVVTVTKQTNAAAYLFDKLSRASFPDNNALDLKRFMETDSLYYGCRIFRIKVPGDNLIVIRKSVLAKDRFITGLQSFNTLNQFIKTNHIQKLQPVIAQYLNKGKDSAQVNVGYYIDKEVKSANGISFERMPKGGPLYATTFAGKFNKRGKAYTGMQRYLDDHHLQQAVLPFETYLDDQLPSSDTSTIKIRLNFSAYF